MQTYIVEYTVGEKEKRIEIEAEYYDVDEVNRDLNFYIDNSTCLIASFRTWSCVREFVE